VKYTLQGFLEFLHAFLTHAMKIIQVTVQIFGDEQIPASNVAQSMQNATESKQPHNNYATE